MSRDRSRRIDVRVTKEQRALIDAAVEALRTDLNTFATSSLELAAHDALAGRRRFFPDGRLAEWDQSNDEPPREIEGLRSLINRPSPFGE